jgi:hypothetical protein
VVTVGPVDGDPLGTFGWFIGVRCRHRNQTKERSRFGACVICRRSFADHDRIHMVLAVTRNGETVGNRLCCAPCAEQHATFHHLAATPTWKARK